MGKVKKSVGVYLEKNGSILLQKRAATEIKDGVEKEQSNPYICQPTFNGKAKEGENIATTLLRECREELGGKFYQEFDIFGLKKFGI